MRSASDVTETAPAIDAAVLPDAALLNDATVLPDAVVLPDVTVLPDAVVLRELDEAFASRRAVEARIVRLSGEVVQRSRSSLGQEGLAARWGETSAAAVVAQCGRIGIAEARRFCRVAEATRVRVSLVGEMLPALYPAVAAGLGSGSVGIDAADHILRALAQAAPRATVEDLSLAESALVEFATVHPADLVRGLAARYRDALDSDGVEPREEELVAGRSLRRTLLPNGLKRFQLDLDPLSASHLDASIDAVVGAAIRRVSFAGISSVEEVPDPRSLAQIGADALVDLARHGNSCTYTAVPTRSVTIVVRMSLTELLTGLGTATIDGCDQPISATTARLLAADAHVIPAVLGGEGEILDLGRSRRLFTRAQRLALAERDGGCAFPNCDRPPTWTEAHHIDWWSRNGTTDLDNGVLLCTRHHHTVHAHGWGIDVRDTIPWFLPPPTIDPRRTPRRGGRPPALGRTG